MANNQTTGTQNPSDEGTKGIDEYASVIDGDNPDKVKTFLQNTYSDEELTDILAKDNVVVTKSIKKAYNADISRSQKQSEYDKLLNLAKGSDLSAKPPTETKTSTGDAGLSTEDEERIAKLVDKLEALEKIDERFGSIEEKLASAEGRTQSLESMQYSQESRIRSKRLQEGFKWLKDTVGEEDALRLYDPDKPKESAIGHLLQPELIDDSTPDGKLVKEWALKRSPLCYDFDNPVAGALRIIGTGDVMEKAFGTRPPETEGAGKSTLGEAKKDDKIADDFFEGVLGIEKT